MKKFLVVIFISNLLLWAPQSFGAAGGERGTIRFRFIPTSDIVSVQAETGEFVGDVKRRISEELARRHPGRVTRDNPLAITFQGDIALDTDFITRSWFAEPDVWVDLSQQAASFSPSMPLGGPGWDGYEAMLPPDRGSAEGPFRPEGDHATASSSDRPAAGSRREPLRSGGAPDTRGRTQKRDFREKSVILPISGTGIDLTMVEINRPSDLSGYWYQDLINQIKSAVAMKIGKELEDGITIAFKARGTRHKYINLEKAFMDPLDAEIVLVKPVSVASLPELGA